MRPSRGGRLAALVAAALIGLVIGACSGSGGSGSTSGTCVVADAANTVTITANNLAFSTSCIEAVAGKPIVIHFTNQEPTPHDVAVFTDSSKKEELARSDLVTGPNASTTVTVPARPAGQLYFECTIHPAMNGSLVVRDASASP